MENIIYEFHCGAAACKLAANEAQIELRTHGEKRALTWKPRVTVEFPIAPGRVTYARLGEVKGVYRLLIMGGKSLETERFSRGNIAKVRLDSDMWEAVKRAVAEGYEHHYILALGDVREELLELGKLMGIRTVIL